MVIIYKFMTENATLIYKNDIEMVEFVLNNEMILE